MIVVTTRAGDRHGRGMCSRWLTEVSTGTFVGNVHPAGIELLKEQLSRSVDINLFCPRGKVVVRWSSADQTESLIY